MWLEVTVSRLRKGDPAALLAAPSASAHERARTVAEGVSATQPQEPALSRSRRECSKTLTLEARDAVAQAERQPSGLYGRRAREERAAAEARRAAALRHLLRAQLASRLGLAELAQRATASDQTPSWAGAAESSR